MLPEAPSVPQPAAHRLAQALGRRAGAVRAAAVWRTAALLALPLLVLAFSRVEVMDDAYIGLRYARNLIQGDGLVYNPGERVEGMTDLLWTLVLALPVALDLPVGPAAAGLGIGLGLLATLLTARLARRLGASPAATTLALLVLALCPGFWLTVANGLEGGLFAVLLLATLAGVLGERPWTAGVAAGLLLLTRPESAAIPFLAAFHRAIASDGSLLPRSSWRPRRALPVLLPWLLVAAGVTLFRHLYYGAWLPNSLMAKSPPIDQAGVLADNLLRGARYCAEFAFRSLPLVAGAALAPVVARRRAAAWLLLAVVASELPAVLINGGDWMPNKRLLAVYAPVLAVLLALTLDGLLRAEGDAASRRWRHRRAATATALVLTTAVMLERNHWQLPPRFVVDQPGIIHCYEGLARRLEPVLAPSEPVAAEAIGLLGHVLEGRYVHDMLGLTDTHVARRGTLYRPRSGKMDIAHTLGTVRPVVIANHEQDVTLALLDQASGGRFSREYESWIVHMPPPCAPHGDTKLIVSLRRDAAPRLRPALAGLELEASSLPR